MGCCKIGFTTLVHVLIQHPIEGRLNTEGFNHICSVYTYIYIIIYIYTYCGLDQQRRTVDPYYIYIYIYTLKFRISTHKQCLGHQQCVFKYQTCLYSKLYFTNNKITWNNLKKREIRFTLIFDQHKMTTWLPNKKNHHLWEHNLWMCLSLITPHWQRQPISVILCNIV